ncbi:MAG: filamentous hemagglutinin [Coriobacteriia bacterium]|nr:filamentous hemagglutinin [Coriobacteriia bacterium]
MGSSISGLYVATHRDTAAINDKHQVPPVEAIMKAFGISPDERTATVWGHISATQAEYPGTYLPRSFVVNTPNGNFWTHGHATKHMYSAVKKAMESPSFMGANHGMLTQFLLYDYRKSIAKAAKRGIRLDGRSQVYGHWEIAFSKRREDKCPVVMHAKFLGFK